MHYTLQKKLLDVPWKKQLQIELLQYQHVLRHVIFKKIVLMHAKKTGVKILELIQCVQTVQIWLQRGEKLHLYPTGSFDSLIPLKNVIMWMNIALNMVVYVQIRRRRRGSVAALCSVLWTRMDLRMPISRMGFTLIPISANPPLFLLSLLYYYSHCY